MAPVTVLIPLGGLGTRFAKEGYLQPKPFINVLGKPMILWVLDSLKLCANDAVVIVYDPSFIPPKFWEPIASAYPNLVLVELDGPTRGAAETVMLGLSGVPRALRERPVMLIDGDTFYEEDIVSQYREVSTTTNAVFYFVDTQPQPLYSYIVFDDSARISQVKEKVKISDHANTGCYCFMRGVELESQCRALLEAGATQLSQDAVGEYYTSGVIARMIDEGHAFRALRVDASRMHVLGTPAQLRSFCTSWRLQPTLRICFDLDHTLVTAPRVSGDYSTCEPIPENIAYCRQLYEQGHTIIIATGRRMRTHKGNVAAVVADVGQITLKSLQDCGIPYHEISFGKPYAQFYIDDLAVSAFTDLPKAIGFYAGSPMCARSGGGGGAAPTPPPPLPPPPAEERRPSRGRAVSSAWVAAVAGVGLGVAIGIRIGKGAK